MSPAKNTLVMDMANEVAALGDLLDAIFSIDMAAVDDGNLDLALAGPGLAVVGSTIAEKVRAMAEHARQLFELATHAESVAAGGVQ